MRPDEHKKKRSAQYKKKHGIDDKNAKKEELAANERPKHQIGKNRTPAQSTSQKSTEDEYVTQLSSESGEQSFARRVIESNWQRYELPPESDSDDDSCHKANDFNLMLQSASSALSQFQFKDEKEWAYETHTSNRDNSLLSIDCVQLAATLRCVPLHQRLGIEEDVFEESQINQFNQDARLCQESHINHKFKDAEIDKSTEVEAQSHTVPVDKKTEVLLPSDDALDDILGPSSPAINAEDILNSLLHEDSEEEDEGADQGALTKDNDILDELLGNQSATQNQNKGVTDQSSSNLEDWINDMLDD